MLGSGLAARSAGARRTRRSAHSCRSFHCSPSSHHFGSSDLQRSSPSLGWNARRHFGVSKTESPGKAEMAASDFTPQGIAKEPRWKRMALEAQKRIELGEGGLDVDKMKQQRIEENQRVIEREAVRDGEESVTEPRAKLREWTRSYYRTQSADWIRRHMGLPFIGFFQKFQQQRQWQRIWANRCQRREGYSQFWKAHCVFAQPTIHWDPSSLGNRFKVDDEDMHYFFYERPPQAILSAMESDDPSKANADGLSPESEEEIARVEESLFRAVNMRWEWELRNLYADSHHHSHGWAVFSEAKKREALTRAYARELRGDDYDPTEKLETPEGSRINPFMMLPEQNPFADRIPFGGKSLKDYAEKAAIREKKMLDEAKAAHQALLEDGDGESGKGQLADVDLKRLTEAGADGRGSFPSAYQKSKDAEQVKQAAKRVFKSFEETLPQWAKDNYPRKRKQIEGPKVKVIGEDGKLISEHKEEVLSSIADVRINQVNRMPRLNKSKRVVAIRGADEKEDDPYGVLTCTDQELYRDPAEYCFERPDVDHPDMFEDNTKGWRKLGHTRAAGLDALGRKMFMDKRPEVPGFKLKKESGLDIWLGRNYTRMDAMVELANLSRHCFKNAYNAIKKDLRWVFKEGGGKVIRAGVPPQVSLMEFTAEEQMYVANGAYGPQASLFADWMICIDRKAESRDHSKGRATIVHDRMIFEGFLHHSGVEAGHRLRHRRTDHIGYVNLACPEYVTELDLDGFHSVGLKVRTDGRPYLIVLECSAWNECYLTAGVLHLPPTPDGEWDYYEIPLHHFRVFDKGEFIASPKFRKVRWLRSMGIMAIGKTGGFHLEVQWMRIFREDARFNIDDTAAGKDSLFIRDLDAMGIYERDMMLMHKMQQQYFQDDFPDPFRFEDDGVFELATYLGPPKVQREHFAKLDPSLLKYVDLPDELPLPLDIQEDLSFLQDEPMLHLESAVNRKQLVETKAIQKYYTEDSEVITNATNTYLAGVLQRERENTPNVFFQLPESDTRLPFKFRDPTCTPNTLVDVVTVRRRKLLRELVDWHLREIDPGKKPHLI